MKIVQKRNENLGNTKNVRNLKKFIAKLIKIMEKIIRNVKSYFNFLKFIIKIKIIGKNRKINEDFRKNIQKLTKTLENK